MGSHRHIHSMSPTKKGEKEETVNLLIVEKRTQTKSRTRILRSVFCTQIVLVYYIKSLAISFLSIVLYSYDNDADVFIAIFIVYVNLDEDSLLRDDISCASIYCWDQHNIMNNNYIC